MKKNIFKKASALIMAGVIMISASGIPASAETYSRYKSDNAISSGNDYYAEISATPKITVNDGWVISPTTVKSSGRSITYCSKLCSTTNKCKLTQHQISSSIWGLGGGSVSVGTSSPISLSGGSNTVTTKYDKTPTVTYTYNANIWRLYGYSQTHSTIYNITNKNGKTLEKIDISTTVYLY